LAIKQVGFGKLGAFVYADDFSVLKITLIRVLLVGVSLTCCPWAV
jgi:hypothetical protein